MRLEDWERRFDDCVTSTADDAFEWGKSDCVDWACGIIHAITGVDPVADLRGTYDSRDSATALMQSLGGDLEAVVELFTARLDMQEVNVSFAQRGDLLLMDTDSGAALGVVSLEGTEGLFKGPRGVSRFQVTASRRAWRVG